MRHPGDLIALVVSTVFMFAACLGTGNKPSEPLGQVIVMLSFVIAIALFLVLDARQTRREKDAGGGQH